MTSSPDDWDEMHEQPFDEPLLSEFLDELRSWGTGPAPEPNAALASLLQGQPDPGRPRPSTPRRKKHMITSKLAGLGIAAKAALGLGVAAAAVTTAGATGVLPPPAQHAVASVVDAVTPLQLPDPTASAGVNVGAGGSSTDVSIPASTTTTIDKDATDDSSDDATGAAPSGPVGGTTSGQPDNHGACVSAVAQDKSTTGRDHGKAVSTAARSDCGKTGETSSTTSTSSTSSTSTTSTTTAGGTGASVNSAGGHGNGNGNQGNADHGKSGRD
jgi:hypothetical protein